MSFSSCTSVSGAPAEVKAMWSHTWDLRTPLSISFSHFSTTLCCARLSFDLAVLSVQKPRQKSTERWLPPGPYRKHRALCCSDCESDIPGCLPTAQHTSEKTHPHSEKGTDVVNYQGPPRHLLLPSAFPFVNYSAVQSAVKYERLFI